MSSYFALREITYTYNATRRLHGRGGRRAHSAHPRGRSRTAWCASLHLPPMLLQPLPPDKCFDGCLCPTSSHSHTSVCMRIVQPPLLVPPAHTLSSHPMERSRARAAFSRCITPPRLAHRVRLPHACSTHPKSSLARKRGPRATAQRARTATLRALRPAARSPGSNVSQRPCVRRPPPVP